MFRCQPSRFFLRRATVYRTYSYHPSSLPLPRFLSTTPATRYPRKDTMDKDSLNPSSSEYAKSGTDDAAAGSDAAFNPDKTSPEEAEKTAEKESGGNSLNVSPGNQEVSKPRGDEEGGAQGSPRTSSSSKGSAPKSGGEKSG